MSKARPAQAVKFLGPVLTATSVGSFGIFSHGLPILITHSIELITEHAAFGELPLEAIDYLHEFTHSINSQ